VFAVYIYIYIFSNTGYARNRRFSRYETRKSKKMAGFFHEIMFFMLSPVLYSRPSSVQCLQYAPFVFLFSFVFLQPWLADFEKR